MQTQTSNAASNSNAVPGDPFKVVSDTKSTDIDARLKSLLADFDALRTSGQSGASEYQRLIKDSHPRASGYADADIAAIDRIMGGGLQGELAALRAKRKSAVQAATGRALGDVNRMLSVERMGRGGGRSGYLDRLALDKSNEVHTQAALDDAAAERADLDSLTRSRLGLLGGRQEILDRLAGRSVLPSQSQSQLFTQLASLLGLLNNTNQSNTFYGVGKPLGVT